MRQHRIAHRERALAAPSPTASFVAAARDVVLTAKGLEGNRESSGQPHAPLPSCDLHLMVTIVEAVVHRHEAIWMQARQSLGLLQRLFKLVEVTLLLRPHENRKKVDGNAIFQLFLLPIHDVISKRGMDFSSQSRI
jgi:hypothetical protein